MTHKERLMAAINHKKPDRVPYDMWFTPEVIDRLYKYLEIKGVDTSVLTSLLGRNICRFL